MALYMYIDELTFLQVEACELALHLLDVFRVQEVIERGAHPVIRRLSQYVTEKIGQKYICDNKIIIDQ